MKYENFVPIGRHGIIWRNTNTGTLASPHHHEELELNVVVQGSATYLLDHRTYSLTRNTMVWLFPAQNHVLIDLSPDLVEWVIVFTADLVKRYSTEAENRALCEYDPPGYFCKHLLGHQCDQLFDLYEQVRQNDNHPDRFNAGLANILLSSWSVYMNAERAVETARIHPAVEKATQIIRTGHDPESIEALADQLNIGAPRLGVLFKRQMGVSLVQFRNRQRVERFLKSYEEHREWSMLEAAIDAGFGSYTQFYRVFHQVTGISPSDYRRQLKGGEEGGR